MVPVTEKLPPRFSQAELVGSGSQGQTWRAHDATLDRLVAVKVFTLAGGVDWKAFELFERECATLRALDHAGIPDYHEHFADENNGRYYLVMEFIAGDSLAKSLAQGRRRTEDELRGLLVAALEIVEYLHGLRPAVVHRDIKPGNLIQRADGSLALVDFGSVTDALRSKGGSTMIGTFGYMAPEQLYGSVGPATDLYALGATIAAIAAGVEGEDLPRDGLEVSVDAVVEDPELRRALRSMTRADPDQRAKTVDEVRALLEPKPQPRQLRAMAAFPALRESDPDEREHDRGLAAQPGRAVARNPLEVAMDGLSRERRRKGFGWLLPAAALGFVVGGPVFALGLPAVVGLLVFLIQSGIRRYKRPG